MKKLGLPFLLLLYLYPITLNILPFLSSRKIMGIFGGFLLLFRFANKIHNKNLLVKKDVLFIVSSLFLIASFSFFTVIYNGTSELQFVSYTISNIIIFVSAYFVIKLISNLGMYASEIYLIKLMIFAVALQCLISILMNFMPSLNDFILSILSFDEASRDIIDNLASERLIGFGLTFFWAGAYCGIALILIVYLIKSSFIKSKEIVWFVLLYSFIFIVGMMMARTTLIGATISVILFFIPFKKQGITYRSIKFISLLFLIPTLLIYTLFIITPDLFLKINYLISFAFEMFINLKNNGQLQTDSTDVLKEMYIIPNNLKTWIIGDGYWMNPFGEGYYMHTDVGHLRMIYYFGIIGLSSFILSQFIILKAGFKGKLIVVTLFSYLLVLNFKGFFEYTPFMALLIASHYDTTKTYSYNKNS